MGYYTRFKFKIEPAAMEDTVMEAIKEISGYDFDGTCKWYEHEEHMQEISRKYPAAFITVFGDGEEAGDLWCMYCANGKTERVSAQIVYPPPTIKKPEIRYVTIEVTLAGRDIPVEVEVVGDEPDDVLYERARATLRKLL